MSLKHQTENVHATALVPPRAAIICRLQRYRGTSDLNLKKKEQILEIKTKSLMSKICT